MEGVQAHQDLLNLVRTKTDRQIHQPSNHSKPESPLNGLPDNITHVYTKQHQTTGLQSHFEGPFEIAERVSTSVVKLKVGTYKDNRIRYEYRHLNDIKPAHPKSLAAPMERPKLGRPTTSLSASPESSASTEASTLPPPSSSNRSPPPNSSNRLTAPKNSTPSKQTSLPGLARENSNSHSRPVRTTRNPKPLYVDAVCWSASSSDLVALNKAINAKP